LNRTVAATAAVVLTSLVGVGAGQAAGDPRPPRPAPKQLWRQFPLDQSARAPSPRAATTTSHPPVTSQAPASRPAARPASAERARAKDATSSPGSVTWLYLAGLVLVAGAATIAWRELKPSRREEPGRTERPRGLDLILNPGRPVHEAQAQDEQQPTEVHLSEGSNEMPEDPRGVPVAQASDQSRETYDALGDRIASVLAAAQDAADETTRAAKQEAADIRANADAYSEEVRQSAEAAAAERRADAEAEAARILTAAEERAKRIENSAIEHRRDLVAEAQSLQDLLDQRRLWLREMIGALRDATGRLESVTDNADDATGPISQDLADQERPVESGYVG
jgi:hypothetical protein